MRRAIEMLTWLGATLTAVAALIAATHLDWPTAATRWAVAFGLLTISHHLEVTRMARTYAKQIEGMKPKDIVDMLAEAHRASVPPAAGVTLTKDDEGQERPISCSHMAREMGRRGNVERLAMGDAPTATHYVCRRCARGVPVAEHADHVAACAGATVFVYGDTDGNQATSRRPIA